MEPLQIYHEKQSLMFCGIHSLNNLFQSKKFTKQRLDEICSALSPNETINPHKSILGLGNYDVNVIIKALEAESMDLIWFDKRKDITSETMQLNKAFGFILNIPSRFSFGFVSVPWIRRHWISIRKFQDEKFYNLDSKLAQPSCIGFDEDLIRYLNNQMKSNDKELFVVMHKSS